MDFEVNRKEISRYLGYGRQEADWQVHALIEECVKELELSASPKSVIRSYPLKIFSNGVIDCTVFQTKSVGLGKNLQDCTSILLFAATLGVEVDVLLHKYTRLQMSRAVVMQAAATAMLEDYCDLENQGLKAAYEEKGLYLRPRFSPGYGDFSLECQREITFALETGKRLGIMLTDSLLMVPSKSVTAVLGVSPKPYHCVDRRPLAERTESSSRPPLAESGRGCEVCEKIDCAYRRGEENGRYQTGNKKQKDIF